jgi:hypothetical protein
VAEGWIVKESLLKQGLFKGGNGFFELKAALALAFTSISLLIA